MGFCLFLLNSPVHTHTQTCTYILLPSSGAPGLLRSSVFSQRELGGVFSGDPTGPEGSFSEWQEKGLNLSFPLTPTCRVIGPLERE